MTTFLNSGSSGTRFDETDRSAHSGSSDSVTKLENCPFSKSGWATAAATTEEFSQSIQAPSSTHPGISYPVRANPSLRHTNIHDKWQVGTRIVLGSCYKHIPYLFPSVHVLLIVKWSASRTNWKRTDQCISSGG